ncbi:hypothetical protein K160097B7_05670 [[Clostridium] hylemonae]|uniref:hypothetical protein n=1 Tax=[Clostridium] hylemonae TaxID=89153 RepID=UPI0036F28415
MRTKDSGIGKIKYGELHRFYPFKFKSEKTIEEIYELIKKSDVLFTEEYQNKIMDSLGCSLAKIVKERREDFAKDNNIIIKMQDFDKYRSMNPIPCATDYDNIRLEFEDTGFSIKMCFYHTELEELQQQIFRLHQEQESALRFYGKNFVSFQDRFVLLPFKIVLSNGKTVWLNCTLYVFANGMGILKLGFPLIDIGIEPLKNNDLDSFISKIINKWQIKNYTPEATLFNIVQIYIKSLMEDTGIDFQLYGNEINYISLIDFEGIPKQVNNISKEVQEDLFRIIAAPVPERKCTSYLKDAQEYIGNNKWGGHNVNYVAKTTGGCLSYVDQTILEEISEDYKQKNSISCLNDSDYLYLYEHIATDIFIGVEFALIIIMLKKLNDYNCYYEMICGLSDLSEIQKEYNHNTIFINELQEGCYGSVSEQTDFLEKRMYHYLKQDIMNKKMTAIDNILRDEEKKKGEKFQEFLTVGGFLLTLLFGLPALYDTLLIIRGVFSFIPYDVPIITLKNVSLLLWLTFNGLILLKMIKER